MYRATFNREVKRLISEEKNSTIDFIKREFEKSNRHRDYFGFFDDYLCQFGILSLELGVTDKNKKYIPYINCSQINIFHEDKGITYLSDDFYSSDECQKILADYLIQNLKLVEVNDLKV